MIRTSGTSTTLAGDVFDSSASFRSSSLSALVGAGANAVRSGAWVHANGSRWIENTSAIRVRPQIRLAAAMMGCRFLDMLNLLFTESPTIAVTTRDVVSSHALRTTLLAPGLRLGKVFGFEVFGFESMAASPELHGRGGLRGPARPADAPASSDRPGLGISRAVSGASGSS